MVENHIFEYSNKVLTSKELLTREIPVFFKNNSEGKIFPKNYVNNVKYWGNISKDELHSTLPDGTAKLLTLDIDFGNTCSLNCGSCFRRDKRFDTVKNSLSDEEIVNYIKEGQKIGLKEIKILGRGEPFENPHFFGFLREMNKIGIGVAIFTKGHVLGSDFLAKKYNYEKYGIATGKELINELKTLNVSILLGFNSFNKEMQEDFVGMKNIPLHSPVQDYVKFRDSALINLVKAGFNEYKEGEATRLAMIAAPIKPENLDEIFDIYTWARVRNIYMLSCPTTDSGKGEDEYERQKQFVDFIPRLTELYTKIYKWNLKTGLTSLEEFKKEGISLYPGCHPCNQVASGLFLNLSGQVVQCPGRVDDETRYSEDIRSSDLKTVWINSANYKRAKNSKRFNYHCPARDSHTLPVNFYKHIKQKVLDQVKNNLRLT